MVQSVKLDSTKYEDFPFYIIVDVKDIVNYHILSFENQKLRGERILVSQKKPQTPQKVLDFLNDTYPDLRGKIARGDPKGKPSGLALLTCNMDHHLKAAHYKLVPEKVTLKRLFDQYLRIQGGLDVKE
ncbi:unnamed protein product [Ambrosiozyma monospora]|uniref:Unnamed protein product n=1 Tax=Ambrosiozyma monospora TaxID=43982 RepID=A0ACB5U0B1_AMBMO|nr:unnamed protein product [Ambrosiozyma monospora]